MLFADVVAASAEVAATRSRTAKATAIADLLGRAGGNEVRPVTAWLAGDTLQGRLGVGWRTLTRLAHGPAASPRLTVSDVDRALTELAGTTGTGSAARREALVEQLFTGATADEQRFLVRLLTGDLRQGALEGVVLDAIGTAAGVPAATVRRAFMLSGSLPETAATALDGGTTALESVHLAVGRPVRPMLASPGSSLDAVLADLGADVTVEHKLDGARIQVHRDGDVVRVWTRTLREVTDGVPELVAQVRSLPCRTAVLDGETLALDDDGRPRAFQDTMSRFGSDVPDPAVVLSPFFFDLLHLDGRDLLDEPLAVRLDALVELLAGEEHAALRMPGVRRPTPERAAEVLDGALTAGHEGVVVKALDASYAAGRRGRAWQKVKPVHTLDLVVLGAEWGYGRRSGKLSNIHLGARDPDGGGPVMVGKTFKGMTDELLDWQTARFPDLAREQHEWGVLLEPELVVEVALDGAQRSPRYPGGVALRFARVLRYRPDRSPADADTLDAVRALLAGG
ncbi:ATP-dependent DNA ligase [Geodermatophilus obscurus]|uniref:Probable DNA ligase n=1 Tax=Geodermatophilus obscurus (strain ATCC 25078 / DSM 43160 / JCM 3152 / CCUG 61914 / KCC A-0152 / KCTC 9177 / NBRC 13315 / NRRL B-3577 / G-20) TaxID=526225 RepID=D2SH28_GEOOG|nr:ATP-dependent DNA ligase [Geodermatophilus obscurus]ADB75021.1 DNA ligase I, ATP-dependent Dnl1 [Geodermatophilus obscurus DSM 43160]